jgi:hypothetical protein
LSLNTLTGKHRLRRDSSGKFTSGLSKASVGALRLRESTERFRTMWSTPLPARRFTHHPPRMMSRSWWRNWWIGSTGNEKPIPYL